MRFSLTAILLFTVAVLTGGEKIASLSPNLTEIVCLLGGEESLCGRSSACDYPPQVQKLPVVGRFGKADPEAVLASGATIVITAVNRSPSDRKLLEQAIRGMEKRLSAMKRRYQKHEAEKEERLERRISLSDYASALRILGGILGKREEAEREIRKVRKEMDRFRRDLRRKPKVFILISDKPLCTAGQKTFLHELVELAGGENLAGTEEKGYFTVSPEWVLLRNPEIVVFCGGHIDRNSVLRSTEAFRTGRILTDLDPSLLYRLGPRSIEAVRKLHEYFRTVEKGANQEKQRSLIF